VLAWRLKTVAAANVAAVGAVFVVRGVPVVVVGAAVVVVADNTRMLVVQPLRMASWS
jgi:hypothetical protein